MDLRDAFWFAAGLLTALAVDIALRSWLPRPVRPKAVQTPRWFAMGALIVAVPVLGLYAWRGNSNQSRAEPAAAVSNIDPSAATPQGHGSDSLDSMLTRLENRLRGGGGTAADWELLAQTYDYLGRSLDASNARERHEVSSAAAAADGVPLRADLIETVLGDVHRSSSASAPPDAPDPTATVEQRPARAETSGGTP